MKGMRGRYTAVIVGCMVAMLMTACGGGGGGTAAAIATATLTGSAGDGPIAGGTVTVTDVNGNTVATTTTDANAHYSVAVPSTAALPLTVTISGGTDLITKQPPSFPLKSAVTTALSTVSDTTVNANPLTTIAVDTATALGGLTTANLNTAITNVRNALGFGSDVTFNPISGTVDAANVATTVKANEAVGEMIRRTVAASGDSVANVIGAIASDLTDGTINGRTKAGVTNALVTTKLAMQVQSNVAQVAAETMSNALKITNTSGATVVTAANSLGEMETAAATSNGGSAPTTSIADVPINTTFIEQAKAAVNAAINLAAATGVATTNLTAFRNALGTTVTAGQTGAAAATALGTTAADMETETASTITATTTATETELSDATDTITAAQNFKLSADTLTVQDYNGSNVAQTPFVVHGSVSAATGVMTANFGTALNAANMSNLAQSTPTGTSPKFSFALANLPVGSGTATVTALLKDGLTATRVAGQRMLKLEFTFDWSSDGSTLTLTAPAGSATATYYTKAGTAAVTATLTNAAANILSTGSSVSVPSSSTTVELAISNLFNTPGLGAALNGVSVTGTYYYQIDFSGFPMVDANNTHFSTIEGTFSVQ